MKRWLISQIVFACLVAAAPCMADSWTPAQRTAYLSPDKASRLRVIPRPITSQLGYFSDKVKGKEPAGATKGSKEATARAIVERLDANGSWVTVWDRALTNEVAPVEALISNDAQYVATFDNWHGTGYGPNVVAIYDHEGLLVRKLALSDLLPAEYIDALSHSVSSIQWRGTPRFSGDGRILLPVVVPNDGGPNAKEAYVDAVIRLADGAVLSGATPEWRTAIASAHLVAVQKREYEKQAKRTFIAPLLGPTQNTEPDWHDYLREGFFRTAHDWEDNSPATTVLRDPKAQDYAASEDWLRDDLLALDYRQDVIAIASIASFDYLVERMKAILVGGKKDKLKGVRLYIAAPLASLPTLQKILAPTGAKVICLDPSLPIPQRPERLKRYLLAN